VKAASRQFSGWRNAVRAAGFSCRGLMPSRYVWTRTEILRVIREREERGLSNQLRSAKRDHPGLTRAGRITFGSWPSAVRAGGGFLPPPSRWTPTLIVKHLKARAVDGYAPRANALGGAFSAAATRHFGTFEQAAMEAGLKIRPQRRKWTKERVLRGVLQRLKSRLPISGDPKLMQAVLRMFGGVMGVKKELGLLPRPVGEALALSRAHRSRSAAR